MGWEDYNVLTALLSFFTPFFPGKTNSHAISLLTTSFEAYEAICTA